MKLNRRGLRRLIESVINERTNAEFFERDRIELEKRKDREIAREKTSEFVERLKVATLGHFVTGKKLDSTGKVMEPFLRAAEAYGQAGTDEEEIYAVFREIKALEIVNPEFELEDVAKKFKAAVVNRVYRNNVGSSLYDVLKDELSESEIAKVEEAYPGCMTILERL